MGLTQLPSGSWRYQIQEDKKRISITFDHRPTKKEINAALEEKKQEKENTLHLTFRDALVEMIDAKGNVLSPATIRSYLSKSNQFSEDLMNMEVSEITSVDIQREVNRLSKTRSPKSVRDYYSIIVSVLSLFRPNDAFAVKLPMKQNKADIYIPTQEDIKLILENCDDEFRVAIMLGCYGMRRGEICALTMDDIEGNIIHVYKDKVLDKDGKWVIKYPKTTESKRDIYVSDEVIEAINTYGLYTGHPNSISKHLSALEKKLGIPQFSLHKMRHYFASQAHAAGIPDADILAFGGWKTDNVMKSIYRHATNDKKKVSDAISDGLF